MHAGVGICQKVDDLFLGSEELVEEYQYPKVKH